MPSTPLLALILADLLGSVVITAACLTALAARHGGLLPVIRKVTRIVLLSLALSAFACYLALLFGIHRSESAIAALIVALILIGVCHRCAVSYACNFECAV